MRLGQKKTRPKSAALVISSLVLFYQVRGGKPERILTIYLDWKQRVRRNWGSGLMRVLLRFFVLFCLSLIPMQSQSQGLMDSGEFPIWQYGNSSSSPISCG